MLSFEGMRAREWTPLPQLWDTDKNALSRCGRRKALWQMASEHARNAGPTRRARVCPNLSLSATFGKTKQRQSALGQVHCRIQFSSVRTLSRVRLFATPLTAARQSFLSTPNPQELAQTQIHWVSDVNPTILSSVVPFSCLQSFPASGSFPTSQFFASGGQNIGVSASASVLSMNIQGWFPVGLTSLISLLSKRLLRVFSSTTFQKYQFFSAQLSLWSNSQIHTWLLEKP